MRDGDWLAIWTRRWEAAVSAATRKGASAIPGGVVVGPAASDRDLALLESEMGVPMPASVRRLFLVAGSVDIAWDLDDESAMSGPFEDLRMGGCAWNAADLPKLWKDYSSWLHEVFPDAADPYDSVWQDKYPLLHAVNGDMVAIGPDERVMYLSHEGGEGHGYALGNDVFDFLDRWATLGCPGPEDWQWLPFTSGPESGLEPDGANGRVWRDWFGLP